MNVKRLGQYPPKDPTCKSEPLIWQTWNKLELDHYIQEYEGGKNKNVAVSIIIFLYTKKKSKTLFLVLSQKKKKPF